jgi:hypothetical protein
MRNKGQTGSIWVVFGSLVAAAAIVAMLTEATSKSGAVWRAGYGVYTNWLDCFVNNTFSKTCTRIFAPNESALFEKLPGYGFTFILLALAFLFVFSNKAKRSLNEFQTRLADRIGSGQSRRETAKLARKVDRLANRAKELRARALEYSQSNSSLNSMKKWTTALIALGIFAGLIGGFVYLNATSGYSFDLTKRLEGIGSAAILGQVSQWLLGVGILGKLLIGTAKIIVEGLNGNQKE